MTISLTILRLGLTVVLLVPVYKETGVWTVITLALLASAIEIQSALLQMLLKVAKSLKAVRGGTTDGNSA